MKKWCAVFWRYNPQLENGGYEARRSVEARTEEAAKKKAEALYGRPAYGTMSLLRIEEEKI